MYKQIIKRILDMILSILMLPFVVLATFLISLFIWADDRHSPFYISLRTGKNAKPFRMYKFRTMKVNAPDVRNPDGSTFNAEDDPRVTRIGRLLRRTSIDELPQIFNVLKGEMSFVGPRPTMVDTTLNPIKEYETGRFSVRPGVTGYSQAFFRNSISQDEKFANDDYYANNVTLILDIRIFLKTILSVLSQKNINSDLSMENENQERK